MKKIAVLLVCFVVTLSVKSQLVDSMLHVYAEAYGQQKVYMHLDKPVYRAGENVWFKAYVFEGFSPSMRSNNFYAELLDESGKIIQRKVYPVFQSSAAGNFDLADKIAPGKYAVRGYTTWMLNFDTAFLFTQAINVVAKDGKAQNVKQKDPVSEDFTFTLFPEGGNLVEGLESLVAFKANNKAGIPTDVKGKITDSKGNEIATIQSAHDGMGSFLMTPEENETYFAVWKDMLGNERSTALPAAKKQGFVLHAEPATSRILFSVKRTPTVPNDNRQAWIIATVAGERVYRAKIDMDAITITSGSIPVKNLPAGVMQITLFNGNWEPLAERVVIVNNHNYSFDAGVSSLHLDVNKRARNEFEIDVKDTTLANLSIAVVDEDVSGKKHASNIISTMLLTGDIKGYVHDPAYYFLNASDSVAAHLDLVMLTHGWRRYNWERLVAGKTPIIKYPADQPLSFKAKVYGMTPGTQLRSDEALVVIFESKDSTKNILQIPRSAKDEFASPEIIIFDTVKAFYQFSKDVRLSTRTSVAFETGAYLGVRQANPASLPFQQPLDTAAISRSRLLATNLSRFGGDFAQGNVLQNVTVRTRVKSRVEQLDEKYASGLFKDDNGFSFDFTDAQNSALSVFTYLQGRVPGLQITQNGDGYTISWRGSNTALFLNEMSVDAETINSLSVSDIAYVKVFRPPFFGSFGGGAGGAIAVYTAKGSDRKYSPGEGLPRGLVAGYSVTKQFYSPDYSSPSASSDVVADYRSTLYWNPVIFTDGTRQKVKFHFYNNDITRAFRVILQGFNEFGKLVYFEKVFKP